MRASNGRVGRVICFVLSILFLGAAIVLLTDAVQVDDPTAAVKLLNLASVLAVGSVSLMIGALVWTIAGREPPDGRNVQSSGYYPGQQQNWGPPPG